MRGMWIEADKDIKMNRNGEEKNEKEKRRRGKQKKRKKKKREIEYRAWLWQLGQLSEGRVQDERRATHSRVLFYLCSALLYSPHTLQQDINKVKKEKRRRKKKKNYLSR